MTDDITALVRRINNLTAIITSSGGGLSNKVPYTGANQAINLNTQTLAVGAITTSGNFTLSDVNIVLGTATGTKIGTATSQKIGFWNATPIVQQTTAIAGATFASNTSGLVDGSFTAGGYTFGQVVAYLKLSGQLA